MEQKGPLQRVQRSTEHIADVFEEISWALADVFDVAVKSIMRVVKSRRQR